jgi:alpha-1,3/alpha-1,6-mannosyltransferase
MATHNDNSTSSTTPTGATDTTTDVNRRPLKVVFLHLDLGIGGAEQLVLQLATASQALGHEVQIFTTRCDADHCFAVVQPPEGVLCDRVQVLGQWIPANLFGVGTALCSNLRVLYLAIRLAWNCYWQKESYDVLVLDVLPSPLWILRYCTKLSLLFYCHFPDKLLVRKNPLDPFTTTTPANKSWYRKLMDSLEEACMPLADVVLVNSKFTQQTVLQEFPSLHESELQILYPALDTKAIDDAHQEHQEQQPNTNNNKNRLRMMDSDGREEIDAEEDDVEYDDTKICPYNHHTNCVTIVSLNRYERKKKIEIILQAFALIKDEYPPNTVQIIIAGGYDTRNVENVEYRGELQQLAFQQLKLTPQQVIFQTSISDAQRTHLLQTARCVVYTPPNEHFGIVPLEVMYAGTPVIACNSGGPLETIVHNVTGLLCDPTPQAFAQAMNTLLKSPTKAQEMGQAGRRHVRENFGTHRLQVEWDSYTQQAYRQGQARLRMQTNRSRARMLWTIMLYFMEAWLAWMVCMIVTHVLRQIGWIEPDSSIVGTMRRKFQTDEL